MSQERQNKRIDRILSESEKPIKSWGIASLSCGIASIPLIIAPYFGLPLAILAVVFHCKQKKIYPTGVSTAGLVTGIVGIVINSIMILIVGLALLFIRAFRGI